jgi:hypothetical protein
MKPTTYTIALLAFAAACGGSTESLPAPFDPDRDYAPDVDAADLSAEITNELMPFPVGATWSYAAETEDGIETIDIVVLAENHDVWGVGARVVRDTVFVAGEMVEDTFDWYAQDGRRGRRARPVDHRAGRHVRRLQEDPRPLRDRARPRRAQVLLPGRRQRAGRGG